MMWEIFFQALTLILMSLHWKKHVFSNYCKLDLKLTRTLVPKFSTILKALLLVS
jgi:hypothetical protein